MAAVSGGERVESAGSGWPPTPVGEGVRQVREALAELEGPAMTKLRQACARLAWRAERFGPGWPPTPDQRRAAIREMREALAEIEALEAGTMLVIDPMGTDPFPVVAGTGAMGVAVGSEP